MSIFNHLFCNQVVKGCLFILRIFFYELPQIRQIEAELLHILDNPHVVGDFVISCVDALPFFYLLFSIPYVIFYFPNRGPFAGIDCQHLLNQVFTVVGHPRREFEAPRQDFLKQFGSVWVTKRQVPCNHSEEYNS